MSAELHRIGIVKVLCGYSQFNLTPFAYGAHTDIYLLRFGCRFPFLLTAADSSHVNFQPCLVREIGVWFVILRYCHGDCILRYHVHTNVSTCIREGWTHSHYLDRFFYFVQSDPRSLRSSVNLPCVCSSYQNDPLHIKTFVSQLAIDSKAMMYRPPGSNSLVWHLFSWFDVPHTLL